MLLGVNDVVLVVSIVVIVCFSIVYISMFALYYFSRKKVVLNHLDDEDIRKQLDEDIYKYNKKEKHKYSFCDTHYRKKKNSKIWNIVLDIFLFIVFGVVFCALVFSTLIQDDTSPTFIGDTSYLVIQTESMKETNDNNKYLYDSDTQKEYQYVTTRFDKYDFISITKFTDVSQIKLYDIVAFKMDDAITVHRVIQISEIEGEKVFTFRGDANPYSLQDETNVTQDRIVGIYNGFKSQALGLVITYFKSGVGIITIMGMIIVVSVYVFFYDRGENLNTSRYEEMMEERYEPQVELPKYTCIKNIELNDTSEIPVIKPVTQELVLNKKEEVKQEIKEEKKEPIKKEIPAPIIEQDIDPQMMVVSKSSEYDLYTKTHFAKVSLAEEKTRERYNEIKNYAMSYLNMTCRFGKLYESYNIGRNKLFLLSVRKDKIYLFINAKIKDLDSKYYLEDVSNVRRYIAYPSKFTIKSDRGVRFAKELVDYLAGSKAKSHINSRYKKHDYLKDIPVLSNKELIQRKEMYKR